MSELRAPDPTLSAMSEGASVYIHPLDGFPRVAHIPAGGATSCLSLEDCVWHEQIDDAKWFAGPCRECFPDAPEPGDPQACDACIAGGPHPRSGLAWQVAP